MNKKIFLRISCSGKGVYFHDWKKVASTKVQVARQTCRLPAYFETPGWLKMHLYMAIINKLNTLNLRDHYMYINKLQQNMENIWQKRPTIPLHLASLQSPPNLTQQ